MPGSKWKSWPAVLRIADIFLKLLQFILAKFFYVAYCFHLSNIKGFKRWIITTDPQNIYNRENQEFATIAKLLKQKQGMML